MGLTEWVLAQSTCSEATGQTSSGRAEDPGMGTRRVRATLWAGGGVGLSPDHKLILGCVEGEGISQAIVVLLPCREDGKWNFKNEAERSE